MDSPHVSLEELEHKAWFRHPQEVWALGDVIAHEGDNVRCQDVRGDEFVVKASDTHAVDPTHMVNADDISKMNNMHEGPLLALLKMRYLDDHIYTFTGDILISINPYKGIEGLYDIPEELEDYANTRTPHPFCVADDAYRMMIKTADPSKKNQSMIVSGESGAGKTECCKYIMRYLASLSERYCAAADAKARRASATIRVEKRVLDCNPFLEAFGNAKTVRNDNSSRFGKFLKIEYELGRIIGARMEHYLLEKARVVSPADGERNYHIFYQLLAGCTDKERTELTLYPASAYHYLTHGGCLTVDHVDDDKDFQEVREALTSVGVSEERQSDMWRVLAGILHLGNVEFQVKPGAEEGDAEVSNVESVTLAGGLLGAEHMATKLCQRMVNVQGRASCYVVNLNPRQAASARDALCKFVYERLFSWLVAQANKALATGRTNSTFVGILDIFGFEIFELNSFEQLCINYANEKLQNLFNHHIFVMEMEQYKAEGINVASVKFVNNQPCVDLIEKKPFGVLMMLDEVCFLGRDTTDDKFLQKMDQQHKGKHEYYGKAMLRARNFFSVRHFAGEVSYCVDGFIDKNNDTLYSDLKMLMQCSSQPFVCEIFRDEKPKDEGGAAAGAGSGGPKRGARRGGGRGGGKKSVSTIASKFKTQLTTLNDTLLATTPHYVRCVKPNTIKAAVTFDAPMILTQLLYAGVLETVRIRREGFPFRESYVEFWRRSATAGYHKMVPALSDAEMPPPPSYTGPDDSDVTLTPALMAASKDATAAVCGHFLEEEVYCMGRTKVFMKSGAVDVIYRAFRTRCATRMQAFWRGENAKWRYKRGRRALVNVQKRIRVYVLRRKYAKAEGAVARVQAHVKRRRQQAKYLLMRQARIDATVKIQSTYRMSTVRRKYVADREARQGGAATTLQRYARGFVARKTTARRMEAVRHAQERGVVRVQARFHAIKQRKVYLAQKTGAVTAQRVWRGRQARQLAAERRTSVVVIQTHGRAYAARSRFAKQKKAAVQVQAVTRGGLARRKMAKERHAAETIEGSMLRYVSGASLADWTQELHAACSWGDADEVKALLDLASPAFARLSSVPLVQRVSIRNKFDGMKSALHSAAASGSVATVRLLVEMGAEPHVVDLFGSTPLHNSASLGDANIEVTEYLVGAVADPAAKRAFLARANEAGETALDAALTGAQNDAPLNSDSRGYTETVQFLLDSGAPTATHGGDRDAVMAIARDAEAGGAVDSIMAGVEAAARREAEVLERRQRERMNDPHYQFLFVAEQERQRKADEEAARRKAEAEAALREATRLAEDRETMQREDEASAGFSAAINDALREAEEAQRVQALLRRQAEQDALDNAAAVARADAAARKRAEEEARVENARRRREEATRAEEEARLARAAAKAEREARAAAKAAARAAEASGAKGAGKAGVRGARVVEPAAVAELDRVQKVRRESRMGAVGVGGAAALGRGGALGAGGGAVGSGTGGGGGGGGGHRPSMIRSYAAPGHAAGMHAAGMHAAGMGGGGAPALPDARDSRGAPLRAGFASATGAAAGPSPGDSDSDSDSESDTSAADWEELVTDEGLVYFHNEDTGQVQWTMPEALKRRAARREARARGRVSGAVNGHHGGVSAPVPPAEPAPPSDDDTEGDGDAGPAPPPESPPPSPPLSPGGDHSGAVGGEEAAAALSAALGGVSASALAQVKGTAATGGKGGKGSAEWEVHRTGDNTLYYYNTSTQATQWQTPPGMEGVMPDSDDESGSSVTDSGNDSDSGSDDDGAYVYPGTPWERHVSDKGLVYFYNTASEETTWTRPTGLPDTDDDSDGDGDGDGDDGAVGGRNGWVQHTAAGGRAYYYNTRTDATQWSRPDDF